MVLVVGGAGYIGSHMCKLLREQGIDHLVFDSLEKGSRHALGDSRFVLGDLRDTNALERVFSEFDVDLVMHFAAYIEVGESVQEPAKYYWNNLYGVQVLLEQMRKHSVDKFIFSSTAAVYGEPIRTPIDEKHPAQPESPYGNTKLAVERMAEDFSRAYPLRAVRFRYFNAAGSDPDGVLGEDHRPETHLIPRLLLSAMGKVPEMKIFGTDYDTPDGTCIRDYVHVMDLVKAHLLAIHHLREGGDSDVFNLGYGQGFSVREVVNAVEAVLGRSLELEEAPRRPGDPAVLVAESQKVKNVLGWKPQYDDLQTIVRHAWQWREKHPDGYPL
jgi:UDP-glucose 4-epimerase